MFWLVVYYLLEYLPVALLGAPVLLWTWLNIRSQSHWRAAMLVRSGGTRPPLISGLLVGVLAAASIWSKQTLAPIVVALPVWALLIGGWRWGWRCILGMALAVGAISYALLLTLGVEAMLFHTLIVPARHPWQWPWFDKPQALLRAIRLIRADAMPAVILLSVGIVLHALCAVATRRDPGWQRDESNSRLLAPSARLVAMVVSLALILGIAARPREWLALPAQLALWGKLTNSDVEIACRYARQRPGQVYVPQYPLATLFSDGRTYHFEPAVQDLHLAGLTLSPRQLAEGLPPRLREILVREDIPAYLPPQLRQRFTRIDRPADMPGWLVLRQP
ncbi:MAG TPA: hypothetical protein VNL70_00595 [Tepidisphaeraceae bacterium]|nr:hypothetical protein [Tepidisphaeraceae bacterium]